MTKLHGLFALLMSGVVASSLFGPANAQSYPTRPIELVSPTSAGSGTDIYARALADIVRREKLLPHGFVVQNRTGGGSVIAYNYFKTENLSEGLGLLEAKKLRVLAVTTEKRMPLLPDLPTATEAGYKVAAGTIRGFAFPAGVPAETAKFMESVLERAHKSQIWKDHAARHYYEDKYLGSADYAKFLVQRMEEYKEFYNEVAATKKPAP